SNLALDVSDQHRAAQQRLADTVDELRQKFGRAVLFRGHDFILRLKNGGGEEPVLGKNPNSWRKATIRNPKSEIQAPKVSCNQSSSFTNPSSTYNLAVVQRQRIGSSFARTLSSPAPDLRFRTELKSPAA